MTRECHLCGAPYSASCCAVGDAIVHLIARHDAGELLPPSGELVRHLVEDEGWPPLIATDAAVQFSVANDDYVPPIGAA